MHREPGLGAIKDSDVQLYFRDKFLSYVGYLLLTLYLQSVFEDRLKNM